MDGQGVWEFIEPTQARIIGLTTRITYPTPRCLVRAEDSEVLFGVVPFNAADPVSARLRVLDLKDGAARGHASGQWTLNALTLAPIADGSDASEAPPRVELIELASIELAARMPEVAEEGLPEPLTRIEAFGFDADGNLEVLSSDDTGLVGRTLDRTGAVLRTKHLGRFEFEVD